MKKTTLINKHIVLWEVRGHKEMLIIFGATSVKSILILPNFKRCQFVLKAIELCQKRKNAFNMFETEDNICAVDAKTDIIFIKTPTIVYRHVLWFFIQSSLVLRQSQMSPIKYSTLKRIFVKLRSILAQGWCPLWNQNNRVISVKMEL